MMKKGSPVVLTEHKLNQEELLIFRQTAEHLYGKEFAKQIVFAKEEKKDGVNTFKAESGLKVSFGGFFRQRGKFIEKFLLAHDNLPNPRMADCAARAQGMECEYVAMISAKDIGKVKPYKMSINDFTRALNESYRSRIAIRQKIYDDAMDKGQKVSDDFMNEADNVSGAREAEKAKNMYTRYGDFEAGYEYDFENDPEYQAYEKAREEMEADPNYQKMRQQADEDLAAYFGQENSSFVYDDYFPQDSNIQPGHEDFFPEGYEDYYKVDMPSAMPEQEASAGSGNAKSSGKCIIEVSSREDRTHFAKVLAGAGIVQYELGYGRDGNAIISAPLEDHQKILDALEKKGFRIRDEKTYLGSFDPSVPFDSFTISAEDAKKIIDLASKSAGGLSIQLSRIDGDKVRMSCDTAKISQELAQISKAQGAKQSDRSQEKQAELGRTAAKGAEKEMDDSERQTPTSDFLEALGGLTGGIFAPDKSDASGSRKGPHLHDDDNFGR